MPLFVSAEVATLSFVSTFAPIQYNWDVKDL